MGIISGIVYKGGRMEIGEIVLMVQEIRNIVCAETYTKRREAGAITSKVIGLMEGLGINENLEIHGKIWELGIGIIIVRGDTVIYKVYTEGYRGLMVGRVMELMKKLGREWPTRVLKAMGLKEHDWDRYIRGYEMEEIDREKKEYVANYIIGAMKIGGTYPEITITALEGRIRETIEEIIGTEMKEGVITEEGICRIVEKYKEDWYEEIGIVKIMINRSEGREVRERMVVGEILKGVVGKAEGSRVAGIVKAGGIEEEGMIVLEGHYMTIPNEVYGYYRHKGAKMIIYGYSNRDVYIPVEVIEKQEWDKRKMRIGIIEYGGTIIYTKNEKIVKIRGREKEEGIEVKMKIRVRNSVQEVIKGKEREENGWYETVKEGEELYKIVMYEGWSRGWLIKMKKVALYSRKYVMEGEDG